MFFEPTADFGGQGGRRPARADGNDEIAATHHGGDEEIAGLGARGGVDPEAAYTGVGDNAGVYLRRGGREDQVGAVKMSGGVGFGSPVNGGVNGVGGR